MGEVEGKVTICIHSETLIIQLRCGIIQHMFDDETECVNLSVNLLM
jgi:hypothetical protein